MATATLETSYTSTPSGSPMQGGSAAAGREDEQQQYWPLTKCRRCYTDYIFSKRQEIDEQILSRRYYHCTQYTAEQQRILKQRNQPIMTFNRIARKLDGVIGLIEKLRQDPKAYPRTPQHQQGADLASAALRYVLDDQQWKAKSPLCALDGAMEGIGGIELSITPGDRGDPDIGFDDIDISSFFYDPRSFREDFSDARYLGLGKWVDDDVAQDMFPGEDPGVFTGDDDLTSQSDRELRWYSSEGFGKRVRIVDIWYKHHGQWCYAIFTGQKILREGVSPFVDEKGKTYCKYIMYSSQVDQDGDRYGFVRNMKSAQDGINAKQSKMQHILHSKRLILSQGAVDDIEKTRAEWARPDGVIVTNRPVNEGVRTDDQTFDFAGLAKLLELNLTEIENFGPNPALIGQGLESSSGRAIALLQQAGIAELGPYILAFRGWKIRVYRAIWNAIARFWQAERWIRVTDDEGLMQFVQINKLGIDPMTGMPVITNAIGSLDVDIIIDEGPDATTLQLQSFETIQALGPQFMEQFPDIAIELSPLDGQTKKIIRDQRAQAAQAAVPKQQLAMQTGQAELAETTASAQLKQAQAAKAAVEAQIAPLEAVKINGGAAQQPPMQPPPPYELPPELQTLKALADIQNTRAATAHKAAMAAKTAQDAAMKPFELQNKFELQKRYPT